MGIFGFLKKKNKKEDVTLKFGELKGYLETCEEKSEMKKLVEDFCSKAKGMISEAETSLQKLEEASLMNDKIPERAKHIIQGNRKQHIRKTRRFLEGVRLPADRAEAISFSKDITKKLDDLSRETQKSYAILSEFLRDEVSQVTRNIKVVEDSAKKLEKELKQDKYSALEKAGNLLAEYEESISTGAEVRKELKEKKEALKKTDEDINRQKKEIEKLKRSSEYKGLEEKKKKSEELAHEITKTRDKISAAILVLNRPLKKYKYQFVEPIIDKYLEDAPKALLDDRDMKILESLETMGRHLGKFGLKSSQEERVKAELEHIKQGKLGKLKEELENRQKEEKRLLEELEREEITCRIEAAKKELRSLESRKAELELEHGKLKESTKKKSPEKLKEEIKEEVAKIGVIIEA